MNTGSLLHAAHKAERKGEKTKAEELYRKIIKEFPASEEAVSAITDLREINPTEASKLVHMIPSKINHQKEYELRNKKAESILYAAHKAEQNGEKIKAEELYIRIIKEFSDTEIAKSAIIDLREQNPIEARALEVFVSQKVDQEVVTSNISDVSFKLLVNAGAIIGSITAIANFRASYPGSGFDYAFASGVKAMFGAAVGAFFGFIASVVVGLIRSAVKGGR